MTTYRSFAKVNLHLQVVGRRADGYHELRTIFQTVDLHDLLTVELAPRGIELVVGGAALTAGPTNLAHRAAATYLDRWAPGQGVRLELEKRIPIGGGLGGGSSNAACVLVALQAALGAPASLPELWGVARGLGADVPYFLVGGTALGVGRGDEVIPLDEWPEEELWLAVPPVVISTREVFSELGELTASGLASSIISLVQGRVPARLAELPAWNDLQDVVLERFPAVRQVYNLLVGAGAEAVRLSGSGAALFACFDDPSRAAAAASVLPPETRWERVRTLSRASFLARRVVP